MSNEQRLANHQIRVLVVDDSAVLRQSTKFILESDPGLKVVGEAKNGEEAVAMVKHLKPDVITMDVRMPRMGGLDAIRHIMADNPTPIVVVSSVNRDQETDLSSQARKLGAVCVLRRPGRASSPEYQAFIASLIEQVKLMSEVKVIARRRTRETVSPQRGISGPEAQSTKACKTQVVAIGSSTGGPAALHQILSALPADFYLPILIVQHISFGFVAGLVGWLDAACKLRVKVAEQRERIRPGTVYVAPDGHHLQVGFGRVRLSQGEPVTGHRPSVTVLFESVAGAYGPAAVAVILTGMGSDGARGMRTLRDAGAMTLAQDEASCVVFGMPKEAIGLGGVLHVVPLGKMAPTMTALCRRE
jgi:two-component system chemotaxis response regulator CheB